MSFGNKLVHSLIQEKNISYDSTWIYSRFRIMFPTLEIFALYKIFNTVGLNPLYALEVRQHWIYSRADLNRSAHYVAVPNLFLAGFISDPWRSLPPWSNLYECHCLVKKDHSLAGGATPRSVPHSISSRFIYTRMRCRNPRLFTKCTVIRFFVYLLTCQNCRYCLCFRFKYIIFNMM